MKCSVCGAELQPNDMFCANCGSRMPHQTDVAPETQSVIHILPGNDAADAAFDREKRHPEQKKGFEKRIAFMITCVVTLAVCVFAGVFIFFAVSGRTGNSKDSSHKQDHITESTTESVDSDFTESVVVPEEPKVTSPVTTYQYEETTTVAEKEPETVPATASQNITVNIYPQVNVTGGNTAVNDPYPEYRSYPGNLITPEDEYSEDTRYVQRVLISLGYSCGSTGADGYFGTDTTRAVQSFQAANGLDADGLVGPDTWNMLQVKLAEQNSRTVSEDLRVVSNSTPGHAGVVLRSEDTNYSDKLAVLPEGTLLWAYNAGDNGYINVETQSGQTGWVLEKYLDRY